LVPILLGTDYVALDLHRLPEDTLNPTMIDWTAAAVFIFFFLLVTVLGLWLRAGRPVTSVFCTNGDSAAGASARLSRGSSSAATS
jgi:hypothetical protein